ncbi:hypothetical protein [Janibacter alittae]|uniref:Sensor domain-containing protein n=1 Tax=Janibacter alittae TaxID=3115209 RepID=A0ABZ2MHE9_9MICO
MGHRASSRARAVPGARRVASVAVGALVLGLSGCGDEPAPEGAGSAPAASEVSSSASSTDDRPVADRFITSKDLPGTWRDSEPPGPGFKQLVCGVDIEPQKPVDGGAIRYSQGGLGPFLAQHVRIHSDATTPAAVVRDVKASLTGCTSYETKGNKADSPTVRFDVEPLEVKGLPANAVAWRQTATTGAGLTTDMVLVTDDHALVALVSYALKDEPDPQVLEDAVSAVERMD